MLLSVKIIFSDHANNQLIERKIPKKYILETIKNPENNLKSFKNRRLLQRQFSGRILEVVTIKEEDFLTVITEYWLEEES